MFYLVPGRPVVAAIAVVVPDVVPVEPAIIRIGSTIIRELLVAHSSPPVAGSAVAGPSSLAAARLSAAAAAASALCRA